MTDIIIAAQVLQFDELTDKQQEKLIADFKESQAEIWRGFDDFDCDMEFILKDYSHFLKIFQFCQRRTSYNLSFSQGDFVNIWIQEINLKEWLKTLKNNTDYSKLAKSLLRCDNAFNQINDNIDFKNVSESFSVNINIKEYNIDDIYYKKYSNLIDFFENDIKESIETINKLVYSYLRDSYHSCFDDDYAKEALSNFKYTDVNGFIVSKDYI